MYDLDFIFDECGFADLPEGIERARLFNVSFDVDTGEIKLYVLDASERFAYKITRAGITRQYAGDDPRHGGDHRRLEAHLGSALDPRQIVIDAVEGTHYYVYVDDASPGECLHLLRAVARACRVPDARCLAALNRIAGRHFATLDEAVTARALSLVRVPLGGDDGPKLYSRPFLHGSGFTLNARTRRFLTRLYRCAESDLAGRLTHAWVANALADERIVIVTQYHALLHEA